MLSLGSLAETLAGCGEGARDSPKEGVVLIVADDRAVVEADLAAGRLVCPRCGRACLGGWGCARRRAVRTLAGVRRLRPRRGRCRERACRATHVLLPDVCLARRRYVVGGDRRGGASAGPGGVSAGRGAARAAGGDGP